MKKRLLHMSPITSFLGLTLFFFFTLTVSGQPVNPDLLKSGGSRLESIRANQHSGQVNPRDVIKARQQAEALRLKNTSAAMGLNWLSAGPDNFSGQVWSAIYDNTDPTGATLIAGAEGGGIWKSFNIGLTWTQMAVENNTVPRVSSLVQSANGTIYASTGITSCGTINLVGNGIYRSVNGGPFAVIPGTVGNPDFYGVAKLAIATQSGRLFAATVGGLYYSDNGDNWVKIKTGYTKDVCVGTDGTVITAVDDSAYLAPAGNLSGWITLTTGLPDALPNTGIGWMVFAIAPSDANIMYASVIGLTGRLLNIYNSTDKGLTWSIIFPKNGSFEPYFGYGCYSNTLIVSPNDPFKLYLGGLDMWLGQRVESTGYYNWEEVSFGFYSPWIPDSAPAFHHSYMFSPANPNQIVVSTDGGVSICTLGTDTITFKTTNKLMRTSQFNSVSFSAQRGFVMGGGDHVGTLAMGYFYPEKFLYPNGVNSPTEGFPLWYPEGLAFGLDGGSCEWSNIDSRISVFTAFNAIPHTRRRDMNDLTYVNDFINGVEPVDTTYIPMRLWESFNFAQTHDSVKYYARIIPIPADTTIMVESACNKFRFPYVTTTPIPLGDSIVVADPIASRFFCYGFIEAVPKDTMGIFMTKDMLKFDRAPEYFLIHYDTAVKHDIISTITVSADLNTVWAGTKLGRLIRVSGLLQAYDSATANITSSQCVLTDTVFAFAALTGRYITSISINPANTNLVMITLGNYGNPDNVYYTQNGNDPAPVFTSVQGNLPQAPVYSGLLEMTGTNNAIVGTDFGVFSTSNLNAASPQWGADMENIGDVPVTDIRQQVMSDFHILNYGVIYLASYGRGLWMDTTYYSPLGIEPVQGERINNNLKLNPNPVKDILYISYLNENTENLGLSVYDVTGRLVMNLSLGTQPKGILNTSVSLSALSHGTYIIKVGNGYGKIVKL